MKLISFALAVSVMCKLSSDACCGVDADGDGYASPEDCDDMEPAVNPGMDEVCDGMDNNCNGVIDDVPCDPSALCATLSVDVCDQTPGCRWLAANACGEPALPESGCYPSDDCLSTGVCSDGLKCTVWWVNPCWNEPCDACGMEVGICQ